MTNPFIIPTMKELERKVLNDKSKRDTCHVIEVLPPTRIVKITGEED